MPQLSRKILLEAINKYHPKSLVSLRIILEKDNVVFADEFLLRLMRDLESEGSITVKNLEQDSFFRFLGGNAGVWWLCVAVVVSLVESLLVVYDSQNLILVSLRALLSLLLLGYIPGYAVTRAVFPYASLAFLERLI
ncbi:MAG TPA: hypothetical protein VE177_05015, partial [Candidatus Binatus sp.]|nr:hypothetical protein [Candidatus Binatus sp.]